MSSMLLDRSFLNPGALMFISTAGVRKEDLAVFVFEGGSFCFADYLLFGSKTITSVLICL